MVKNRKMYRVSADFRPNTFFCVYLLPDLISGDKPWGPLGIILIRALFFAQIILFPLAVRGVSRKRVGSKKRHA